MAEPPASGTTRCVSTRRHVGPTRRYTWKVTTPGGTSAVAGRLELDAAARERRHQQRIRREGELSRECHGGPPDDGRRGRRQGGDGWRCRALREDVERARGERRQRAGGGHQGIARARGA